MLVFELGLVVEVLYGVVEVLYGMVEVLYGMVEGLYGMVATGRRKPVHAVWYS